jgi:hypothetical protein
MDRGNTQIAPVAAATPKSTTPHLGKRMDRWLQRPSRVDK